jgi:ferredoxin-NADP reductase
MKAKLIKRKEIAQGTVELEFDLLGLKPFFEPGQYFYLNLLNPKYNDEKGKERHFSIVNTPNEKGIIRMATRLTDSAFKRSLNEMEIGTVVGIHSLAGKFLLPVNFRRICFLAGGIGITPFMNFLQYIKETNLDYEIVLLYSNRNQISTTYFDQIKQFENELENFQPVFIMTDDPQWSGEKRIINQDLIKIYLPDYAKYYFMVAGPPGMTDSMNEVLFNQLNLAKSQVMIEKFIGY